MLEMRYRLEQAFVALTDAPLPGQTMDQQHQRFHGLLALIGWCEDHPHAARPEYLAEVERLRREGASWPEVRILEDEPGQHERTAMERLKAVVEGAA